MFLWITLGVVVVLLGIGTRHPRIAGNIALTLVGAYVAWIGGVLTGVYGMGFLIMPVFPLFILPVLALMNPKVPWVITLFSGALLFSGIAGAGMKTLHPHWKSFGNAEADLMVQLWQSVGFIAACTFGIALLVILACLGLRTLLQRNGGS